jgi:lysylphosphatidylglycerol synthetase-like protein (DUF2156 family)
MTESIDAFLALFQTGLAVTLFIVILLWSLVWKMLGLYRAGVVRQKVWFVVLFFINTAGILEILYLFVFSKRAYAEQKKISPSSAS